MSTWLYYEPKLIIICCTLLTYVLLVVLGYQFGRGDLVQLDPLMVHAAHPSSIRTTCMCRRQSPPSQ